MSIRPSVRIVQQFDEPDITALIPDLEATIIGPAYHIADILADTKADLAVGQYDKIAGLTIASPPDNATGAILDPDSVMVLLENIWLLVPDANGSDGVLAEGENTLVSATGTFETWGVEPGDRVVLTESGGPGWTSDPKYGFVREVESETELLFTSNITGLGGNTAALYVVQRFLASAYVPAAFVTVVGQEVTIDPAATIEVDGVEMTIASADAYMSYRSLRQDLNELTTIERVRDITNLLGKIDERNPLAVGAFVALQNTSTSIKVFGITKDNIGGASDRAIGYAEAADFLENREDVYALTPLTTDLSIINSLKGHAIAMSDPDKSRFRIVLGSGELPDTKIVSDASDGTGIDDSETTGLVFVDPDATFITNLVDATDSIVVDPLGTPETLAIARVLSEKTILLVAPYDKGAHTISYEIDAKETNTSFTVRGVLNRLNDNTATFDSDGVAPGDVVEVSLDGTFADAVSYEVIANPLSENRLLVDWSEDDSELPTLADGTAGAERSYRVIRTLNKAGQVEVLASITESVSHHRLTMVWPGQVLLTGVQNNQTGIRSLQPGFYLACALAGQIAGSPSQQNLTGLAVAGIDELRHSSSYFTDSQLDALMEAGWNVYVQATRAAAPRSLRTLTTDTSFLELMELMIIKNFDFVSIFFRDLLRAFLKGYNVLPETLELIRTSFNNGTEKLRSRVVAKIGAPLQGARIADLRVKEGASDHVEILASVDLPRPLNTLTLFLTA